MPSRSFGAIVQQWDPVVISRRKPKTADLKVSAIRPGAQVETIKFDAGQNKKKAELDEQTEPRTLNRVPTEVWPRATKDKERFPPNKILLMLAGGLLWMGWTGFNGRGPYEASIDASLAVLNTHVCAATCLLVWLFLDVTFFRKPYVIGVVHGMITGLICFAPAASLVQGWTTIIMGMLSGSIQWYTMMVLYKKIEFFAAVDDTLVIFHIYDIAGSLGGIHLDYHFFENAVSLQISNVSLGRKFVAWG